jgi:ribulose-phosphate 3-epimerase
MSVNPGFGGQRFLPGSLRKIEQLAERRSRLGLGFKIEIDGGVGLENAAAIARAGAEWLVAGSSVFGAPDSGAAVRSLRQAASVGSLV